MEPVRAHLAILSVANTSAQGVAMENVVADALTAAGHQVTAFESVKDSEVAIRAQLTGWIEDPDIDLVIVLGEGTATSRALAPLVEQPMPGFADLLRMLAFQEIGAAAMRSVAEAARCGGTFVFVLPANENVVRAAMAQLILPQLDPQAPANLVAELPRLREEGDVTRVDRAAGPADNIPVPIANEKTRSGGLPTPRLPAKPAPVAMIQRTKSRTGRNVLQREIDDPTKPIEREKLERQLEMSKVVGDATKQLPRLTPEPKSKPPGPPPRSPTPAMPMPTVRPAQPVTQKPPPRAPTPAMPMPIVKPTKPAAVLVDDEPPETLGSEEMPTLELLDVKPLPPEPPRAKPPTVLPSIVPPRAKPAEPTPRAKPPTPRAEPVAPVKPPAPAAVASPRVKPPTPAAVPVAEPVVAPSASPRVTSPTPAAPVSPPVPLDELVAPSARVRSPTPAAPVAAPSASPRAKPPTPATPPGSSADEGAIALSASNLEPILEPVVEEAPPLPRGLAELADGAPRARPPTMPPLDLPKAPPSELPHGEITFPPLRRSRAPIVIGVLVLLGVAGAVVWFTILREREQPRVAEVPVVVPDASVVVEVDAAVVAAVEPDEIEMAADPVMPRPRPQPRVQNPRVVTPPPRDPPRDPPPVVAGSGAVTPERPVGDPDCDETACVMENYARACCAQYKPAGTTLEPIGSDSLTKVQIKAGIDRVRAAVIACGDKVKVSGTVKVSVVVDGEGTVQGAEVQAAPDPALGTCVAGVVKKARFASTANGGSFTYPFVF